MTALPAGKFFVEQHQIPMVVSALVCCYHKSWVPVPVVVAVVAFVVLKCLATLMWNLKNEFYYALRQKYDDFRQIERNVRQDLHEQLTGLTAAVVDGTHRMQQTLDENVSVKVDVQF